MVSRPTKKRFTDVYVNEHNSDKPNQFYSLDLTDNGHKMSYGPFNTKEEAVAKFEELTNGAKVTVQPMDERVTIYD